MRKIINKIIKRIKEKYRKPRYKWPINLLVEADLRAFRRKHGYEMNINAPVSFTEKIQWYKLFYDGCGNMHEIVDKYHFKQYIEKKIGKGYTIPLLGYWTNIQDLKKDWHKLPEVFCLKSTISSEGNNIKIIHNKSNINISDLAKEIKSWLNPKNTMLDSYCRAYYKTKPGILAEEYMENVKNQLYDFKVFCFDGQPYCIYAAIEHFDKNDYPIVFYDLNWNKLDVKYGIHQTGNVPCPSHLKEMIDIAKQLSVGFPFVRVDFFDTDKKLLLAEMTFYPGGGLSPYYPKSFDEKMGSFFNLPTDKA